ncbi:hypothetical protein [Xanthomonas sp. MWU16-30325]|uniref:hypothetical protein n=1 Tax=Xanthomonas sp. MWU16-30325 TaxID=2878096 RepID=UPI001CF84AA9|nr:hypothetical protein [Xanthomonas sp. MWU16-30325]
MLETAVKKADIFGQVAASFAFSMLGFLAAVMALFSLLGQSRAYQKYRRSGFLWILLWAIAITMIELILAFVASMRVFLFDPTHQMMSCVILSLAAALGMVIACSTPIIGLQIRSARE